MNTKVRKSCIGSLFILIAFFCSGQNSPTESILLSGKKICVSPITEEAYNILPASVELLYVDIDSVDIKDTVILTQDNKVWRNKWKIAFLVSDGRIIELKDSITDYNGRNLLTDSAEYISSGNETIWHKYKYLCYIENIGYHLLFETFIEGGAYLLINNKTGYRFDLPFVSSCPQFNNEGNLFVTFSLAWPYSYFGGYQLMRAYPDSIHVEWIYESQNSGWLPDDVKWFDNKTFYSRQKSIPSDTDENVAEGTTYGNATVKERYIKIEF